jgi:hypothetical protein
MHKVRDLCAVGPALALRQICLVSIHSIGIYTLDARASGHLRG